MDRRAEWPAGAADASPPSFKVAKGMIPPLLRSMARQGNSIQDSRPRPHAILRRQFGVGRRPARSRCRVEI